MYKKIILGVAVIISIAWLINSYSSDNEISPTPENKKDNENIQDDEDQQNESGTGGGGSGSLGTGTSISGSSVGEVNEGESEITELFCTSNIDFSAEINTNNEETTTDDEVILVMQNNDNSIYQNFNVYVDNILEGTITLNSGSIASIISNEMTTWWQSLDLSQVVSRNFNVMLTNNDDCEVTSTITLDYPYEGAPYD